jgi:dihydroorotase
MFGIPVIQHAEDLNMTGKGSMHEGLVSTELGIRGIPAASEAIIVARDILLAELTRSHYHVAHVSTEESIRLIREAKAKGLHVTCEVTPHHFAITDEAVKSFSTNTKMSPPLRSTRHVEALKAALKDGTIDAIATDHAPHTSREKSLGIEKAPFGVVGLETAVSLILDRLVRKGVISLNRFVELFSSNPARLLGLPQKGRISAGADADLTLLDLSGRVTVDRNDFESKGRNTPFNGWKLEGRAVMTIVGGRVVFPFDFSLASGSVGQAKARRGAS